MKFLSISVISPYSKYLTLASLLFLCSCGGETTAPANNTNANGAQPMGAPAAAVPKVYLSGAYATSEAGGHALAQLFDGDASSGWQSAVGTGPDEGLMLYFANNLEVKSLTWEGTGALAGAGITVYANGKKIGTSTSGKSFDLNQSLWSLYLRVGEAGLVQEKPVKAGKGEDIVQKTFDPSAFVGLKSLILSNAKGEPIPLVLPEARAGKITASSTLAPATAYSSGNLFDSRKEFVWCEGNVGSAGKGESIRFDFDQPVRISALQIWNGYQRSDEHYASNARMKDFTFGAPDAAGNTYTLRDTKAGQKIDLSAPFSGSSAVLNIKDIYPGTKYPDMALSELLFFDGETPFILKSTPITQALAATLAQTPAAAILNHRIANKVLSAGYEKNQSIILRADGTFVLYSNENYDQAASAETIADGNWQLVEGNVKMAKLKLFGKWFDQSQVAEYYAGTSKREITRIFNDNITVENGKIKGGKLIGDFWWQ